MASMTLHWVFSYFFILCNLVIVVSSSTLSSFPKGLILDLIPSLSQDALILPYGLSYHLLVLIT